MRKFLFLILFIPSLLFAHLLTDSDNVTPFGLKITPEMQKEIDESGMPWTCYNDKHCKRELDTWNACCHNDCVEVADVKVLKREQYYSTVQVVTKDGSVYIYTEVYNSSIHRSRNRLEYACPVDKFKSGPAQTCDDEGCVLNIYCFYILEQYG